MPSSDRGVMRLLVQAFRGWLRHDSLTQSAAIAFYGLTSLAPLLVIAVGVAGRVLDPESVRAYLVDQAAQVVDRRSAELIGDLVSTPWVQEASLVGGILAAAVFVFSATAGVSQLIGALSRVWEEEVRVRSVLSRFARGRLVSVAAIILLGLSIPVSLLGNAALATLAARLDRLLPTDELLVRFAEPMALLGFLWLMLTLLFQYLPDRRMLWRSVVVGAGTTTALLAVGEVIIGVYLGRVLPTSAFGAAGSVVVLCLWVYYSCMVLLYGAELTRAYDEHRVIAGS